MFCFMRFFLIQKFREHCYSIYLGEINKYIYICIYVCVCVYIYIYMESPGGSVVKNLPAMLETQVQFLGQEDSQEKEMATYSCILV